ncbi:hypothetical protein DFS33DRAFT_1277702 [Desarmillaria ectypa]|nr:hypothetical protein DFS33DRAFT_1277702 [Desarmillaria ectypa]
MLGKVVQSKRARTGHRQLQQREENPGNETLSPASNASMTHRAQDPEAKHILYTHQHEWRVDGKGPQRYCRQSYQGELEGSTLTCTCDMINLQDLQQFQLKVLSSASSDEYDSCRHLFELSEFLSGREDLLSLDIGFHLHGVEYLDKYLTKLDKLMFLLHEDSPSEFYDDWFDLARETIAMREIPFTMKGEQNPVATPEVVVASSSSLGEIAIRTVNLDKLAIYPQGFQNDIIPKILSAPDPYSHLCSRQRGTSRAFYERRAAAVDPWGRRTLAILGRRSRGGASDIGTSDELVAADGEPTAMPSNGEVGSGPWVKGDIVESSVLRIGDVNDSFARAMTALLSFAWPFLIVGSDNRSRSVPFSTTRLPLLPFSILEHTAHSTITRTVQSAPTKAPIASSFLSLVASMILAMQDEDTRCAEWSQRLAASCHSKDGSYLVDEETTRRSRSNQTNKSGLEFNPQRWNHGESQLGPEGGSPQTLLIREVTTTHKLWFYGYFMVFGGYFAKDTWRIEYRLLPLDYR